MADKPFELLMKRIDPTGDGEIDMMEWWDNLVRNATSGPPGAASWAQGGSG
jgi:hypothetical protein